VNKLLEDEMKYKGLHALSITPKTLEEWEKSNQKTESSPACMGGMKKEHKNSGDLN